MARLPLVAGLLFGFLLAASVSAGAAKPGANTTASTANVLLSRNRTEPVVAIDPARTSSIVAASNTNYGDPQTGTYPAGYFRSNDSGQSFSVGNAPVVWPFIEQADPSLVFDGNGTLFFSYLAETASYCSTGSSAVMLTHSIDRGKSFRPAHIIDTNSADDKPNLAVETVPEAPSHVFLTWTRFHASTSDIWFARSVNGGATFSAPRMLYTEHGDGYGSVPAVAPGHHMYVFWMAYPPRSLEAVAQTSILFRESADDGSHFGPTRVAERFSAIPQMVEPGSLRTLTQPAVVSDSKGALYLAWTQVSRNFGSGRVATNILITRSTNLGRNWTAPRRVNDSSANDRFMPAIALFPNRTLGLAFYDRRGGSGRLDVYAARVSFKHGFQSSKNVRVNARSSPVSDISYIAPGSTCLAPGRFFGDYIGAAPAPHSFAVVWADAGLHVPGETDIWFSKISLPAVR